MIYLCAQPDSIYYAWQVEVMLENFLDKNIKQKDIHIVVGYRDTISPQFKKLRKKYRQVNFGFIYERRKMCNYVSSIRPYILMKYFRKNWQLKYKTIFYHDCDMLFTREPVLNDFLADNVWYQSDTNSYLNYDYIKSKGQDVLDLMLKIGGISEETLKQNNFNSGGAQTIMKNVDSHFWQQVYTMSEQLFEQVSLLNRKKKKENPKYHTLQIWCADMWALNFVAWKQGNRTMISKYLNFTWATDMVDKWNENLIYHNAGVTDTHDKLFMKNKFTNILPYFVNIEIDKRRANSKYYDLVRKMRSKTCLI